MASIKPIPLGNMAAGVNNRLEPEDLSYTLPSRAPATFLQAAENIDLLKSGRARRRKGFTERSASPSHSIWSDQRGAYGVIGTTLQTLSLQGDTVVGQTIRSNLPNFPLSYSRGADGDLYWSNGMLIRRITPENVDRPIAAPAPILALPFAGEGGGEGGSGGAEMVGALPAGRYLVATTMVSIDGESPASNIMVVDLPNNSSVNVFSAASLNLYMSGPNGDTLTLQGTGTDITVIVYNQSGRKCPTLNRAQMPAGQIVRHWNGRMLVAAGNILYLSDLYNFGIFAPSKSYVPFPARIDMLEVVENVLYVAYGDITQRFMGSIEAGLQDCLPYGAIPGSSYRSDKDMLVYWQTERGLVQADSLGNVKNLQEDNLAMGPAGIGATLYREQNGMRQVITTRQGAETSTAIATSYMEAEIIRKGTVL